MTEIMFKGQWWLTVKHRGRFYAFSRMGNGTTMTCSEPAPTKTTDWKYTSFKTLPEAVKAEITVWRMEVGG